MTFEYIPPCRQDLWKRDKPPYRVGYRGFDYADVKADDDGWVDPKMYHPQKYDIVQLKTEDKTKPGWWNGGRWDGFRIQFQEKVLYWRKFKE